MPPTFVIALGEDEDGVNRAKSLWIRSYESPIFTYMEHSARYNSENFRYILAARPERENPDPIFTSAAVTRIKYCEAGLFEIK